MAQEDSLHRGHINAIYGLCSDTCTVTIELEGRYLPLPLPDKSEKFKELGKIKGNRWIYDGQDLAYPYLFVSEYRVICIDRRGHARSCWFNADPALDNPGYNNIQGYYRGRPRGLTAFKVNSMDIKGGGLSRLFATVINLYLVQDREEVGRWKSLQPFELHVDKNEAERLHAEIKKIYETHKPVSFKQLYNYFMLGERSSKILKSVPPLEQILKESTLTPTP